MNKPNIILFLSDQQRFDSLGCNGQTLDVTPRLDRFAAEDARNYTRAYTPQPVCGPARSCIQTGHYASDTGCFRNNISLPEDIPTLARRLTAEGYEVGYVGKWHLGIDNEIASMKEEGCPPTPRPRRGGYDGYWRGVDLLEMTSHGYGGFVYDENNEPVHFSHYRADAITDFALEFLEKRDTGKPFFLMVSTLEPHHQNDRDSYEAPDGYRERFTAYTPPADLPAGKGNWERYYPDYLGCCHSLDENFGRLIDALKAADLYEDSLLIYTSDHGCHFRTRLDECTENGYDDYKRNPYEAAAHIPLLIKGPGFAPGSSEDRPVSLIDLPSSILAAATGTVPEGLCGRNLADFTVPEGDVSTPAELAAQGVYMEISESYVGRALVTERWKYVIYDPEAHPWNDRYGTCYRERYLFDLQTDPDERINLADDPAHADIRAALRQALILKAADAGEVPEISTAL
jgi:arylsulfatase A-like enzyme